MLAIVLRQLLLILITGAPFFFFERRFAARELEYRRVLWRDLGALVTVVVVGAIAGALLVELMALGGVQGIPIPTTEALPPWLSAPLAIVGADFALYWVHRAIHCRPFWRIHRWHHAPRHMYWLAGVRTSLLQGVLYSFFPLVFVALGVPPAFIAGYALFATVANHWMHANLGFKARWLEAVFVTPRIHHIHHSTDPRHHGRNFGGLFSIWDRMFGTFVDPDDLTAPLQFGIPEKVSTPRFVVGV
jgi:sterol desaturase/sphingolipid hydroxylase (fatty acid hydroxylase superfamily)